MSCKPGRQWFCGLNRGQTKEGAARLSSNMDPELGVARKGRPNPFTLTGQQPAGEKLDHAHAAKVELDDMSNLYSSEVVLTVKPGGGQQLLVYIS